MGVDFLLLLMLAFFAGNAWWEISLQRRDTKLEEKSKESEAILQKEKEKLYSEFIEKWNIAENDLERKKADMLQEVSTIRDEAFNNIRMVREGINRERVAAAKMAATVDDLIAETKQQHPELARQISDVQYYLDMRSYNVLLSKNRPAAKAAEEVKRLAGERRQLLKENRQLQYQLDFYEKLFPWLEEFKEVPSDEAISYVTDAYGSEYDLVKKWLSPEEYQKLSNAEKYQLALDRWATRKKTDWDVGIEYERYIGYRLEMEGYKVTYTGATLGLKDMGRDLIATKKGETLVIQCKRWSKEKTIHEKHILQLYGSVAVLASEHPAKKYKAVFITSTSISDVAKKCADYCGIIVIENCPIGKYPIVKCNVNKDGEKIYHLPFDQQYDKVMISKNKFSLYAWTVQEAEEAGFRRAYRWHPNN